MQPNHLTENHWKKLQPTALRTHTLISNGDSSFRKRIHEREDCQVQQSHLPCLELRRK